MGDLVEPRPFQRSDEGGARAEGLFTVHTLHGEAGEASRMHQVRQRGRGALKGIGATHLHAGREKKPLTRGQLQRLELAWPQQRGHFPLSYQLFHGIIERD